MSSSKWQILFALQEAHECARNRSDDWRFNLDLIADEDFFHCMGLAKSTKLRCSRKMKSMLRLDARLLRDELGSKTFDWTSDFVKIQDFLTKSHCGYHLAQAT
ncbi:predicted protein [Verticillium alfalfae VaMs.102]|uniref:Predicted protein n=1 Tax=Verticillium alfalfae (strain VaMs.102 / ATCC MYA-4576 / FGSC 10136) TaxID=526221 RepID=C9SHT1_VERA1|nr:predicted protein [Verticillium alfalfae VaMs.102]EEY18504.1 predicted protein [Verticillium alfalfae VaMs.102]